MTGNLFILMTSVYMFNTKTLHCSHLIINLCCTAKRLYGSQEVALVSLLACGLVTKLVKLDS